MMCLLAIKVLLAAIPLAGVTGERLKARAFLDANNVKVGDPLILTVDFIGTADFRSLHPPALSRHVNRADFKLDDSSAKTQTESQQVGGFFSRREVDVARRLTYRLRPMREGVLWFPALEFEYVNAAGERLTVRSNEIPVHARKGAEVVVAGMGEDLSELPEAGELLEDPGVALTDDESFAWRKALSDPTADAFAAFDFPAARLNEAIAAIRAGDWSRALKVYSRLEWRIGQTEAIERGIVAALALRYQNPAAELPVWRQVGRPVLRHAWQGRLGLVGGGLLAAFLLFWLLGRIIRAFAAMALALALLGVGNAAFAQGTDPFAEMRKMMEEQQQRMQQLMHSGGGFSLSFGGGGEEVAPKVVSRLALSNSTPKVGEAFDFIVELECPKSSTVEANSFTVSESFGLTFLARQGRELEPGQSANPSNVVRRIALPARYDAPFKGEVGFTVGGMVSGRRSGGRRGNFTFQFSNSFTVDTPKVPIEVRPLRDPPPGYGGIVSSGITFVETPDNLKVGTNDVIRLNYRLSVNGFLPADWLPDGAAFECGRVQDRSGAITAEWQGYFVADGKRSTTPVVSVVYYDAKAGDFRTVKAGGSKIEWQEY